MNAQSGSEENDEVKIFSNEDCIHALTEILSHLLEIPKNSFDIDVDISEYALDSIKLLQLSSTISKLLSIEIEPTLLLEYGTIKNIWLL